jgi:hypothetical protein
MTRKQILETADKCVNGERQEQYGTPENNFRTIAEFWQIYLSKKPQPTTIDTHDVAVMMALLKIARIASGQIKDDNYIDLAGYAACAGEIATVDE